MRRRGPRFEFWPGDWFVLGVSFIISFGLAFVARDAVREVRAVAASVVIVERDGPTYAAEEAEYPADQGAYKRDDGVVPALLGGRPPLL